MILINLKDQSYVFDAFLLPGFEVGTSQIIKQSSNQSILSKESNLKNPDYFGKFDRNFG